MAEVVGSTPIGSTGKCPGQGLYRGKGEGKAGAVAPAVSRSKGQRSRPSLTEMFPFGHRPDVTRPHARVDWDLRFRDVWPQVRLEASKRVLESYRAIDDLDRQIEELRRSRAT